MKVFYNGSTDRRQTISNWLKYTIMFFNAFFSITRVENNLYQTAVVDVVVSTSVTLSILHLREKSAVPIIVGVWGTLTLVLLLRE